MPLNQDPNFWLALGQLANGSTVGQQIGNTSSALMNYNNAQTTRNEALDAERLKMQQDAQARQEQLAQTNKTLEYLNTVDPELAKAVQAGVIDPKTAMTRAWEAQKPKNWKDNFMEVGGQLVGPDSNGRIAPVYTPPADPKDAAKEKGDQFKQELETIKTYRGEEPVKTYQAVHGAYQKARSAAQLGSAQGDMSLIYAFMKMNDPTSVVREGEFATAANSGGVSDAVVNIYNRARNGEMLTPDQRKQFLEAADAQYQNVVQNLQQANTQYGGLADSYGVPKERFMIQPQKFEPLQINGPAVEIKDASGNPTATIRRIK